VRARNVRALNSTLTLSLTDPLAHSRLALPSSRYKIPTANDIPRVFNVSLLRDSHCQRTPLAHSSKAVGEPPFFLGTSVYWALKEAVRASRAEQGAGEGWFGLRLPATPERLVLAIRREE